MFEDNGTHVLLLGENNVPPSPLICMVEIASASHEINEVFLCYSLCHVLSNASFYEGNDKCDDINDHVKQHNDLATSIVTSPSYVIRDTNATIITKEKLDTNTMSITKEHLANATNTTKGELEDVESITTNFHNSNVVNITKIQHKPLIIELNKQKEPNARSIMDKKYEH